MGAGASQVRLDQEGRGPGRPGGPLLSPAKWGEREQAAATAGPDRSGGIREGSDLQDIGFRRSERRGSARAPRDDVVMESSEGEARVVEARRCARGGRKGAETRVRPRSGARRQ